MKSCIYQLNFGGELKKFTSEEDLNEFLAKNYDVLSAKRPLLPVEYSKVMEGEELSPAEKTMAKLLNLAEQGPPATVTYTDEGEKVVTSPGKYTSLLKYLDQSARTPENPYGLAYFSEDNYRKYRRDELVKQLQEQRPEGINKDEFNRLTVEYRKIVQQVNKGISNEIINAQIDQLLTPTINQNIENWKKLAGMGTDLHKLSESYFKKRLSDGPGQFNLNSFAPTITSLGVDGKETYLKYLRNLEIELVKRHGEDAIMIPEYKVWDKNSQLVGVVDLLVIDSEGKVHVYDFKTSYKDPSKWNRNKVTTFQYQLGGYSNILRNMGMQVRGMSILPVVMDDLDFENNTIGNIDAKGIYDIEEDQLRGKVRTGINELVKLDNVSFYQSTADTSVITEQLKEAWGYNIKLKIALSNVEKFIKNSVFPAKDGMVQFKDHTTERMVVCKKEDLKTEVEAYFQRESDTSTSRFMSFKTKLYDVVNKKASFSDMGFKNRRDLPKNEAAARALGKYSDGSWDLKMDDPTLDSLGILMFINKNTNTVEFVSYTSNILDAPVKLNMGKSILGNYISDIEAVKEPKLFAATNGNIELMKVALYINSNIEAFKQAKYNIGRIAAFNSLSYKFETAPLERIQTNFSLLSNRLKIKDEVINLQYADDYELLFHRINDLIQDADLLQDSRTLLESAYKVMGDKKESNRLEALMEIEGKLRNLLIQSKSINDVENYDTIEKKLYGLVNAAILKEKGISLTFEQDLRKWAIDGTMVSNPTSIHSENIQFLVNVSRQSMQNIRNRHRKFKEDTVSKVNQFLDEQGYPRIRRKTIGDTAAAYNNLFEQVDGKIDPQMKVKNPYDPTSNLQPHEREFLKFFLAEVNKNRFGITDIQSDEAQDRIVSGQWFEVPLLRASTVSRLINKNYAESLKEFWDNALNVNNLFDMEKEEYDRYAAGMYEMTNTFTSQLDSEYRQEMLNGEKTSSFETNLEVVLDSIMYAKIRQEEYNKALPLMSAIKIALGWQAYELNIKIPNTIDYINKYIKSAMYSSPDIEEGTELLHKTTRILKEATSIGNMMINPISGLTALFQGMLSNVTRAMSNAYGPNMFNKSEFAWAYKYMTMDAFKSASTITAIEEINALYGINNMDINRLVENMSRNNGGLFGFKSGAMYWFSYAPDYFNRMTIFIAQMKHDGCFDAHSMVDGKMVYDFKKDKRFEQYSSGNTSHPDYGKQKALYNAMREEFQLSGMYIAEGDPLPQAYTVKQRESMKMFSDSIHGYYDHDSKIMAQNTIGGMLFLQFKTWLTAKKDQYLLKPGTYAQGDYVQLEMDGVKYYIDSEGNKTTENTGEPAMIWKGRYMEGIWYSMQSLFKEIVDSKHKMKSFFNAWKASDPRSSNLKLFMWDTGIVALILLLLSLIDLPTMKEEDPVTYQVFNSLRKSGQDLNILGVLSTGFSAEPLSAVSYATDVFNSFYNVMSGSQSLGKAVTSNIGFARPLSGMIE